MPTRLLIASLGNPAPYTNTFHSAGHTLLEALRLYLAYPPFSRSRQHGNGLLSTGPQYTLYQSPSFMNLSGKAVATAYSAFLSSLPVEERLTARLIVLHDELESPMGKIKKKIGGSARGHNGIKSVMGSMGAKEFVRIGVGVGRPVSRESEDVARYVLSKMTAAEIEKIKEAAVVLERLLDKY